MIELYSRNLKITEEHRKDLDLPEGEYEELFPITEIPVYNGEILQKGKRNFCKIVSKYNKPKYYK